MNAPCLSYEFDCYRVDIANRLVLRYDEPLPLTPKAFEILLALISHRGGVLSKNELMKIVWPDRIVEDGNLAQNIYLLRKILKEEANGRRYVETVARRGYRFVGEVREIRDVETSGRVTPGLLMTQFQTRETRSRRINQLNPNSSRTIVAHVGFKPTVPSRWLVF